MDHDRPDTFRHPFSNYIEHSPNGPYAFDASRYDQFIAISISNLRDLPIPMRYFQLRKLFDSGVSEDSHLLMLLAWVSMKMFDEQAAVRHLQRAQRIAGVGADPQVDKRLENMCLDLSKTQESADSEWDIVGEGDEFIAKWQSFPSFSVPPHDAECIQMLHEMVRKWNILAQRFGFESLSKSYSALLSVDTNEIEGVFKLSAEVWQHSIYLRVN